MRLVAYAFGGATDPVKDGVIKFGELTTVSGPNDAGKSRLVRTFASVLEGTPCARDPGAGATFTAAVYAQYTDAEREDLLRNGIYAPSTSFDLQ